MKEYFEDVVYLGRVIFGILPDIYGNAIATTTTTPNVANLNVLIGSGAVVTITNFLGGAAYQSISFLGDGTTIIANNTHIKTNTGANKTLTANKVYRFTLINNVWYEDA